ncbi:MAG TPA: hypothetical protein VGJ13_02430 [Pseudonocardiaceae bacterium]
MPNARKGLIALAVIVLLIAATVALWPLFQNLGRRPGCAITAATDAASDAPVTFPLSGEQIDNAATVAAIGAKLGMPDHAVTIALATALQESGLRNLQTGDRDSAGLFQQRPSQGWGTRAQIVDTVYASTAFYQRLRLQPDWEQLDVADAAQLVQRSAAPSAYAQWEPRARAYARALTGEAPGALTCRDLALISPSTGLVSTALSELGTASLSGAHPEARGWAISSWLVAHASRLGIDRVTFDGRTWTMDSGSWSRTAPADGVLSLHQVVPAPSP